MGNVIKNGVTPIRHRFCARLSILEAVSAFVFLMNAFLALDPRVEAAPVTLRFDATIGTVSTGIPFDSGVQFSLGDTISGKFTFDPAEGDGGMSFHAVQPYDFFLNINYVSLFTPSFEIEAINNTVIISDCPAGVDCLSGPVDELDLGGGGLSWVENAPPLNIDPSKSGFRMTLNGMANVLAQASHPSDADVWNDFDLRRQFDVDFEDGNGGAIGFVATLGEFVAIPEPSSLGLASLLGAFILLVRRQIIFTNRRPRRLACDFIANIERVIEGKD